MAKTVTVILAALVHFTAIEEHSPCLTCLVPEFYKRGTLCPCYQE